MKVLICLEDRVYDRYIVKPIVERICKDIAANARVDVLSDPHVRGIDELLAELPNIVEDNKMVDLFVVVVDRDANTPHNNEDRLSAAVNPFEKMAGCCAVEEVEVWMLALHKGKLDDAWSTVRSERSAKEVYAAPFLAGRDTAGPSGGRKSAMQDLGKSWPALKRLCPEIAALEADMRAIRNA